jgi:hypothetical protein
MKFDQIQQSEDHIITNLPVGTTDFSPVEDSILTIGLRRYGYGFWELIKNDLHNDQRLFFNI